MDWTQLASVLAVAAANISTVLILFCHSDKKLEEHRREQCGKLDEHRREHRREQCEHQKEMRMIFQSIQEEMRDFHGRLISLEERHRGVK